MQISTAYTENIIISLGYLSFSCFIFKCMITFWKIKLIFSELAQLCEVCFWNENNNYTSSDFGKSKMNIEALVYGRIMNNCFSLWLILSTTKINLLITCFQRKKKVQGKPRLSWRHIIAYLQLQDGMPRLGSIFIFNLFSRINV